MEAETPQGTKRLVNGQLRIYYDGYWLKAYEVPSDRLLAKKQLIEAMTRRLFKHAEHGINIPGRRLEETRKAYDAELEPQRKRVKGAMLAGALFNRAADIFTKLVELQALGIAIQSDNALMKQCGLHLQEALTLGKTVLHRTGEEGIDELWGEPFKAFAYPIEDFFVSRYLKIASTMRAIDRLTEALVHEFAELPMFDGIEVKLRAFAECAKVNCETLRADADIFDVWSEFVVAGEKLAGFLPRLPEGATPSERLAGERGVAILTQARELVFSITRARTPMPVSTRALVERLQRYRAEHGLGATDASPTSELRPFTQAAPRSPTHSPRH